MSRKGIPVHKYAMNRTIQAKAIIAGVLLLLPAVFGHADSPLTVRHLASEQNIITLNVQKRFLLLPIQDNAPEGRVTIVIGNRQAGTTFNVRLAREHTDYFVPLDLSGFTGKDISLAIHGMPAGAICWKEMKCSDSFDMSNTGKYRPVYHHTPAYGWMNDPNGMFFKDGTYHLFFQYNPYGSTWGNMSWGHSTSTDLADWTFEGIPLTPDAWGTVFSGSAVIDKDNTAGFGPGAIVAFYTSAKSSPWGDSQSQSLAFSTDGGKTFTRYEHNPVLVSDKRDFRDPKVIWYAPGKHWVMVLAAGQEMEFYSSKDLKSWKKESSFGLKHGAHGGVWECPDLVELPVEGAEGKKWVLLCNINPGGPFGGNATQYFVGTFDGKKFVNESPTGTKWMDWGKDHYATVTFSNAPEGRCIALGWMSNWQYQGVLPTEQYRGANTIARDLSLYRKDGDIFLKCAPSREIEKARKECVEIPDFKVSDTYEIPRLLENNGGAYEIEMLIRNSGARKIDMKLSNAKGENIHMYYDMLRGQFVMDRSNSGEAGFSQDFPAVTIAPAATEDEFALRLFVDRSSIEAFGNGGEFVMTNLVFPAEPYDSMSFVSDRGSFTVKSMKIYRLD